MDTLKISEMQQASALDGSELVPIVQGGANKRTTAGALRPSRDTFVQDIYDWTGNVATASGIWRNFFALAGITKRAGGTAGTSIVSQALKFPVEDRLTQVVFSIRISGTIGGSTNTAREWRFQSRRVNGNTIVGSVANVKVDGTDIANRDAALLSYTDGANDPFSVDGAQIGLDNVSGQTLTLTSVSIRVQRIRNIN